MVTTSLSAGLLVLLLGAADCLDNGLARTPPMGWMTWERFGCNTNCTSDPKNCISENLVMDMADRMAADGFLDAGYEYVSIDDCWLSYARDANGQLVADPDRFPSGIPALADYLHKRGLKLGIYEDVGTSTCGGYPGSEGHIEDDAQTFAKWGIDMLKFDGCNANQTVLDAGYPAMAQALNKTGRHILYFCEWPLYSQKPNYSSIAQACNAYRNYNDVYDSWDSVNSIIQFYANDVMNFSTYAGPGSFSDADQLIIGDYGLSYEQQKTQMAMWAIFAAPLIMSTDLRSIDPASRDILLNKNVIAVNQDPLGIQGRLVLQYSDMQAFFKPLQNGKGAIAVLHSDPYGQPIVFEAQLQQLGLSAAQKYYCNETFSGKFFGWFTPNSILVFKVNPSGSTFMITCSPNGDH